VSLDTVFNHIGAFSGQLSPDSGFGDSWCAKADSGELFRLGAFPNLALFGNKGSCSLAQDALNSIPSQHDT